MLGIPRGDLHVALTLGLMLQRLMSELSIWRCSAELKERSEQIWAAEKQLDCDAIAEERKRRNYDSFWTPVPASEPFRCVLAQVCCGDDHYCTFHKLNPTVTGLSGLRV
jgi:hypothetical protein